MALMGHNFVCLSPSPGTSNWNKLIKKQLNEGNPDRAIQAYINMQELGFYADNYGFPVLLKAAGSLSDLCTGLALQGQTIKTGFSDHPFVQTSLLNLYVSLGCFSDAYKVFDRMPVKDDVAWNSMLDAYASCGQMDNAEELFDSMPSKDLTSFNIMVSGYAKSGMVNSAKSIFNEIPMKDTVSWNSMILAYTQDGDMEKACVLFRKMPEKNVVTWNTMITGYLRTELYFEVVDLFYEMISGENLKPDFVTFAGVLSACAHLGTLETGMEVHVYAKDNGLALSAHVTTALTEMYGKCGSIKNSMEVFYKCPIKNIYCWNAAISALAVHGYGYAALKLFNDLRYQNYLKPDDITFIAVLNACSHAGLVQEGCRLFDMMEKEFGIAPKLEHYGCMADLLGRAGLLDSATQLIEAMPFEPGESILGALLNACVIHRKMETGERLVKQIISEKDSCLSDGELMMFANLYASFGQWEEANRWREMMKEAGIVKTAGCSAIEVKGRFHKFVAGEGDGH